MCELDGESLHLNKNEPKTDELEVMQTYLRKVKLVQTSVKLSEKVKAVVCH